MQIGPEAVLWWDPEKTLQDDLFESWVELGEKFYQAVTAAPVPLDMRALKVLKKSPLALDLYSWLAYKTWNAARKGSAQTVSWAGLHAQMGPTTPNSATSRRRFGRSCPRSSRSTRK